MATIFCCATDAQVDPTQEGQVQDTSVIAEAATARPEHDHLVSEPVLSMEPAGIQEPANVVEDRAHLKVVGGLAEEASAANSNLEKDAQGDLPKENVLEESQKVIEEAPAAAPVPEKEVRKELLEDNIIGKPFATEKTNVFGIEEASKALDDADRQALAKAVFEDLKWQNGLKHLAERRNFDREAAQKILREGALAFGLWQLSDAEIEGLVNQMVAPSKAQEVSPGLSHWMKEHAQRLGNTTTTMTKGHARKIADDHVRGVLHTKLSEAEIKAYKTKLHDSHLHVGDWKAGLASADTVSGAKFTMCILVFIASNAYAIKVVTSMYKDIFKVFGWPIYIARAGGMGAALWTAILYLTMSRSLLTQISRCVRSGGIIMAYLDAHKDLHILAGKAMFVTAVLHVAAHLMGTVPGMLSRPLPEINALLGCANPDTTPDFINVDLAWLKWPMCPLQRTPDSVTEILFTTMPGLTGVLLVLLLVGTMYTARQAGRAKQFELFWYFHNFNIASWPVLLFLHGSQAWVGLGLPLVVLTSSLPIVTYTVDRIKRFLRSSFSEIQILGATVRPGPGGGAHGALTYLHLSKPRVLWHFQTGMYGFLNIPEIARFQWHPFTICSGADDETVNFLIAGVGDWTRALAKRCLDANAGVTSFPRIGLDGPFTAPTQSALSKKILVAVGAGVGITPFLSLLSSLTMSLGDGDTEKVPLVEAHFYWSTRSADEFLFGRRLFAKIAETPHLRDRIFLHLHVTSKAPDKDPAAYLFREALRRQNKVDFEAFSKAFKDSDHLDTHQLPLQLPWAWINGSKQDALWVRHVLVAPEEIEEKHQHTRWIQKRSSQPGETVGAVSIPLRDVQGQFDKQVSEDITQVIKTMMPLVFGRPDMAQEIYAIGQSRPGVDVDVYACGNAALVDDLHQVVGLCNQNARDHALTGVKPQKFRFHFERFG
eukprot:TRINITY_DN6572_c0_g1_i11.p1 TRINITY_DN6572_c0_g1~~TRINITY_DN6572_c0_g1_i11.p1  ORF type:complete len:938 (+),score=171.60 TRINITY_DN6572_c0_g1_i11:135-2948(+)